MSSTTFGHSPAELEKKLAVYWDLVEEREAIDSRIAAARREKDSVNERIFRKVMAEYETALRETDEQLTPLKDDIDGLRKSVNQDIVQVDASIQEIEDEIDELHFRRRTGEFEQEQLERRLAPLKPKLAEARDRRTVLGAQLEAMDRRSEQRERQSTPPQHLGDAEETKPDPCEESDRSAVEGATESTPESSNQEFPGEPVPAAPGDSVADEVIASLEDPQSWADEFEPVELPESSRVSEESEAPATTNVEEEVDPLAALSDPTAASEAKTAAPDVQPESVGAVAAVAPAYPSLVIRSGAHSGKIVPLLPMTMSIGREHDNNVELKDPEVARYHARILYADGSYMVEDLESSTGTWVNGERLTRVVLNNGDVIRIGGTELVFDVA